MSASILIQDSFRFHNQLKSYGVEWTQVRAGVEVGAQAISMRAHADDVGGCYGEAADVIKLDEASS